MIPGCNKKPKNNEKSLSYNFQVNLVSGDMRKLSYVCRENASNSLKQSSPVLFFLISKCSQLCFFMSVLSLRNHFCRFSHHVAPEKTNEKHFPFDREKKPENIDVTSSSYTFKRCSSKSNRAPRYRSKSFLYKIFFLSLRQILLHVFIRISSLRPKKISN